MDTNSPEFQAALRDHARSLGVDPDAESHLLSLVQEALLADVPEGWEQGETEDGTLYYFNEQSGESIWEHPLDSHYRDLVKQKRAESPPPKATTVPPAVVEAKSEPSKTSTTEVSNLEVYSFDEESDDDVKPLSKTATAGLSAGAATNQKSSRISSLFDPQPAPSYSAASTTMASTAARDSLSSRSSTVNTPSAAGGFGRDRSWLLDNDDDIPSMPLSKAVASSSVGNTSTSTFAKASEIKDSISSRPGSSAGASASSSLSYTSRLFGGSSSSATPASIPIETTITPLDLSGTTSASSEKVSPRRGIASAIKGPFFQDVATTGSSAVSGTSATGSSSAADLTKIKDLEKNNSELSRQINQLKKELETAKQELDTAKQDAKEANYLKMKANESKTKLTEKDTELEKAKQETSKLQEQIQRLRDECATLKQVQKSATQQEIVDAKKAASDLDAALRISQKKAGEMEEAFRNAQQELEKLNAQLLDTATSLERERKDNTLLKEQNADEKKQCGTLREHLEKQKNECLAQIEQMKREMSDQSRKFESMGVLQEAMERQGKYVKELEEKQSGLLAKLSEVEAKETQANRETKAKELEIQDLNRKVAATTQDLEARDKQLRDLADKLRQEQAQTSEIQSKALSWQRSEDEFDRKKQLLEREKQNLATELRDRGDQIHTLQNQVQRLQEEHMGVVAKLQMEIHTLNSQLKQVKSHEVLPLEKQRDQLTHESDRLREKLTAVEKELRTIQQELTNETGKNHQLQVEIEAWKRKEQQQKTQKETYLHEKMTTEKQLQSLQAEASTYQHDKRLEIEKLAFRLRELESQVAQKDYEILRVEEKFTKAEAWRLKEARRVEERDSQLLDMKEELAQLKSRNIEAENNLIIHELRREKEQLDGRLKVLSQELEDERIARQIAAQKFQDEAENLQKSIDWQLPQLAAACVSRTSEEWTRKCNEIVKALRDDWNMKALTERNELTQRLKEVDERRDHVEQKLKNATAECEFLRKEVHRVEDNNKVLLDQLHTIRVYMMQRGAASVFPTGMGSVQNNPPSPPPPQTQPQVSHAVPPPPCTTYSDFTAVNQLNTQLAVLHSQFQQLFDAHNEPRYRPVVDVFSPSDRFEIPSSPPAQPRKARSSSRKDILNTSTASTGSSSSSSSLDETLDTLLLNKACVAHGKDPHKEKEELLATLETIGGNVSLPRSSGEPLPSATAPLVSMGGPSTSDTMWYQKNYWRTKYQH